MQKRTAVPLATAAASCAFCIAIDGYWFDGPWGNWHQPLRDWGLHWVALVFAVMATWLLLQSLTDGSRSAQIRVRRIAFFVPLLVTCLHEWGQWIWPAAPRDNFDCARDFALNFVGAFVAWAILARWSPLPEEQPRKRRALPRDETEASTR
ncbi:MAG: hypothetical protein RLZZ562_1102 [Planctomycetota bacterium]|jgi:hypothetical protein